VSEATEKLSTEEVARRLGVKRETVYAYVSRGLLARHPASGAHHSEFDPEEVEGLAARARRPDRSSALEVVVESELTLLEPEGRLSYRGRDAIELAKFRGFEEVVALLWDGVPPTPWGLDDERAAAIEGLDEVLGPEAPAAERIAAVVATLAARDRERDSRDPDSVRRAGAEVFAAILAALGRGRPDQPPAGRGRPGARPTGRGRPAARRAGHKTTATEGAGQRTTAAGAHAPGDSTPRDRTRTPAIGGRDDQGAVAVEGIAARLWAALADDDAKPRPEQVAALNAALILLADHELAASTFAARVAASAWAGPYRVILAGLGPLGGSLHGSAGLAVEGLLDEVAAGADPEAALDARIAAGGVAGFGHRVYRDRDPRADHLLDRLGVPDRGRPQSAPAGRGRPASAIRSPKSTAPEAGLRRSTATEAAAMVLELAAARGLPAPNVDFALAVLVKAHGLRDESSPTIFTVARIAGIVAHALEEYEHRLRFRPRASYVGPAPPAA
jgi:citrate synthase